MRGAKLLGVALMLLSLGRCELIGAEDEAGVPDDPERRTTVARRMVMRGFAESLSIACIADGGEVACTLVKDPVLFFSDPVYHPEIGEGTMWIWKSEGRPQVIAQVYNWGGPDRWTMGLYSFASGGLSIKDGDGLNVRLRATEFRPLPVADAPRPAATPNLRMLQMRSLTRRFSASERQASWNDPARPRTELRLLSQPVYRYEDESEGVIDGAVFLFVHGSTNAQIAMLLEAQVDEDGKGAWTTGFGRLNVGENTVLLDERKFWLEPEMERPVPPDHPSNYIRKVIHWETEEDKRAPADSAKPLEPANR
jgi:hypothetical protein